MPLSFLRSNQRQSIASKLLKLTFSLYFVLTFIVTAFHIITEYQKTKADVRRELQAVTESIVAPVQTAIWNYNKEQAISSCEGILSLPLIKGVEIVETDGSTYYARGEIIKGEDVFVIDAQGRRELSSNTGILLAEVSLQKTYNEEVNKLGKLRVFSSTEVAVDRVRYGITLLIINAVIKTAALWCLFLWAFATILKKPMQSFVNQLQEVNMDNLREVELQQKGGVELEQLEKSFNSMIQSLQKSAKELENMNSSLEQKVDERTSDLENSMKMLEQARYDAEEANRLKSQFLANMSHEIRTPMNAILGFADIMIGMESEAQKKHYLSVIHSSGLSLLRIINDILDLSKVEAGKLKLEYSFVQSRSFFEEIALIFQSTAFEKGLDFPIELSEELPQSISIDTDRLKQIIINLLSNAFKFTEKGQVELIVEAQNIDARHFDLEITVRDSGMGIPKEQQRIIFEAFEQQRGQIQSKYGGTGLGLAISIKLARLMNGQIKVQSQVGEGSSFTLCLKRLAYKQVRLKSTDFQIPNVIFDQASILLVDEQPLNRELIKGYLQGKNLDCIEVENGIEAMKILHHRDVSAILLNLDLPYMDGIEIARKIRRQPAISHLPLIAFTASILVVKDELEDFDEVLIVPLQREDLLRVLKCYLPYQIKKDELAATDSGSHVRVLSAEELLLLQKALNDKAEQWETIKSSLSVNDIRNFLKNLRLLFEKYPHQVLDEFLQELDDAFLDYNISKIEAIMQRFLDMAKRIN